MEELLEDKKDVFIGIIGEVIEDEMMLEAIRDGEGAEEVSREEIFKEEGL